VKRDPYLDKYIKLLEATAARAHKDLDRERHRLEFFEGKVERLELVVMGYKNEAGREFVERSDRATEPKKPPIAKVPASIPAKPAFSEIREKWNSLSAAEQEEAIDKGNLVVEGKERPA